MVKAAARTRKRSNTAPIASSICAGKYGDRRDVHPILAAEIGVSPVCPRFSDPLDGRATLRGRGSPSGNGRATLWFFAVRKGSRATMTGSSFLYRPKLAMRVETWKGVTDEETPILYAFRFAIGFDNDQCVCWPSGSCRTVWAPRLGARVCSLGPGRWARAEPNE